MFYAAIVWNRDQAVELIGEHRHYGLYRGGTKRAFEAGTTLPSIVRWPKVVCPGESAALVYQVDLLASFATLVEVDLLNDDGPDSFNFLSTLLGRSMEERDHLIEHIWPARSR
jgi:arylsulfatase A-like enzyme